MHEDAMTIRRTLFTIHMWVGLILGVLLAALGLSGSLLVYDDAIADFLNPAPHTVTQGPTLPLDRIAAAARVAAKAQGLVRGSLQIMLPQAPGEAISVRVGQISPMGDMRKPNAPRPAGLQIFIDPASGVILASRKALLPPILTFAHQLHGNFLMGRDGRTLVVGPLGAAMLILGVSGLVLWWPKRGQWKFAFFVRRTARGLRFHRELHAATGIWIFVVFMMVSFSGVVLAWPRAFGAPPRDAVTVEPLDGATIGPDRAIAVARAAVPGIKVQSIMLPARADQAISVNYLSNGAMAAVVLVDPYRGRVLAVRDASQSAIAWQRPVHQGSLNPVWKFLVFLSGLVPTLFVVTGTAMWLTKRRRHVPMSAPLEAAP
jgi:uncharacterized iron-regulated membrane protein